MAKKNILDFTSRFDKGLNSSSVERQFNSFGKKASFSDSSSSSRRFTLPPPNILKSLISFILVFSFVLSYSSFVAENGKPSERAYSQPVAYTENFQADALESFLTFHEQDEHLPVITELLSTLATTVSISAGGLGMNSTDFDNWQEQNMNTFYQWKFAKGFTFSQLIDGDFEFDVLGYSKQGIYYLCRPFIYTWYRLTTIIDFVAIGDFFDSLYDLLNL